MAVRYRQMHKPHIHAIQPERCPNCKFLLSGLETGYWFKFGDTTSFYRSFADVWRSAKFYTDKHIAGSF